MMSDTKMLILLKLESRTGFGYWINKVDHITINVYYKTKRGETLKQERF